MTTIDKRIFKAYDIRGIYPEQINEDAAYRIAQAYAKFLNPKTVVLGRDVRLSGPSLWEAAKNGLIDHGVDVVDIGVISTDMLYFAVAAYGFDGGITVSASHNPKEYNGMKLVRKDAIPISGDSGIKEIEGLVSSGYSFKAGEKGKVIAKEIRADYVAKCLSFIDMGKIRKMKVVCNAMFGPALINIDEMNLPLEIIRINDVPNGNFPKGQPDPLQEQSRIETVELIKNTKPDLGAAWDADADRFFLFDENGRFIPGYYLTAFLGNYFAARNKGAKIIFDPRLTWAVMDKVSQAGGMPLVNKAGHAFIKERMRKETALFGGETSGHYYFKDFYYADNGLIPFLILLQIFSEKGAKVSEMFDEYFENYPISGEISAKLASQDVVPSILSRIQTNYSDAKIDLIDGLSIEYHDWRANIRGSNTEPLIRLNVEAKNKMLVERKTGEMLRLITP
jgi:phosphomannomutase